MSATGKAHPGVDVLVIGGGIMGLSIALAARAAGRSTRVLERRFPGAGSSGKSGAILRQHYSHPVTIAMAGHGLARYRAFFGETGRAIGFTECGVLVVGDALHHAALASNFRLMSGCGVDAHWLAARELRARYPACRFGDDAVGVLEPRAGFVDPNLTLAAFAAELGGRGGEVAAGLAMREFMIAADRVVGAIDAEGNAHPAGITVIAAGPWSRALLASIGWTAPLEVVRPEQSFLSIPAPLIEAMPSGVPVFADLTAGLYWKREPSGMVRVGDLDYDRDQRIADPDDYDEGVSGEFIAATRKRITARVPAFASAVSWGGCGALYTITPDAQALIGAAPDRHGLLIATGFSGHGFKMAPAVGQAVIGLINGVKFDPFDPDFFAPDRFARGQQAPTGSHPFKVLG